MKTLTLLLACLIIGSCAEKPTETKLPQVQTWTEIPEFSQYRISYMLVHQDTLYVSAYNEYGSFLREPLGFVFSSFDGETWRLSKDFMHSVGPMTTHGDTLFILASDSIYRKLPNGIWETAHATPNRLASGKEVADIVFIEGYMYGMISLYLNALETLRIFTDGSYVSLNVIMNTTFPFAGAKFIKVFENGHEVVYVRPRYDATRLNGLFRFDGKYFNPVNEGLTVPEMEVCPTNSMVVKDNVLYAAFRQPTRVKHLVNGRWENYSDTLPNWEHAFNVLPNLITQTTALAFSGNRLFASTQCLGVLEYQGDTTWVAMSRGLRKGFIPGIDNRDLYSPVVFLEHFKGKLFAGYGKPGYAPWSSGENGLFRYNLKP